METIERIKELPTEKQYAYFNNYINHNISLAKRNITRIEKEIFTKANESLDKYYTKREVAKQCYGIFSEFLSRNGYKKEELLFIEPSAGSGIFLDEIKESKLGFDIAPTNGNKHKIQKNDFLNDDMMELLTKEEKSKKIVFIGNPPFGKRSKLAIQFLNKAFEYSNIVGFIVPIQFRKWSVQNNINKKAKLVLDKELQENAFEFMGKDYKIRCCFQIWVLDEENIQEKDLRIKEKPTLTHLDFEIFQYNRTKSTEKYFDYEWDFAVPRQGFHNYSEKSYSKKECNPKKQWIFFKAKNKKTLRNLLSIDFEMLSKKNIGTPGFGKADVIQEYIKRFR